ncbi:hypothetical protein WUBG_05298, partial [Wuchereria bancrofti]
WCHWCVSHLESLLSGKLPSSFCCYSFSLTCIAFVIYLHSITPFLFLFPSNCHSPQLSQFQFKV